MIIEEVKQDILNKSDYVNYRSESLLIPHPYGSILNSINERPNSEET